jgi:tRNA 2-thiouridine synthesizing protein A
MSIEPHHTLDVCGLFCPEPVMMLHNIFRDIGPGEIVEVWATDPATTRDIPKFCSFLGHELLVHDERGDKFYYLLKKSSDTK